MAEHDVQDRSAKATGVYVAALACWAGLFWLFSVLAPGASTGWSVLGGIAAGIVCVLISTLAFAVVIDQRLLRLPAALVLLGTAAIGSLMPRSLLAQERTLCLTLDLLLLQLAMVGGLWVAGWVERAGFIIPMLLVAALADVWSVAFGLTRLIVDADQVGWVCLSYPVPGRASPAVVIGAADILFIALLLRLSVQFNLGLSRSVLAVCSGATLGFFAAGACGMAIPGLPFIGVAFALAHWPRLRPGRKEMKETLAFIAVVTVALLIVGLIRR